MAEGILKQKYPEKRVESAGLNALVGHPADEKAIWVMKDIMLDISAHRAKQLSERSIQEFDLVFCMSQEQVRRIEKKWGISRGKVFRLGHWLSADVQDPYRLSLDEFVNVRNLIENSLHAWSTKIA